MTEIYLEISKLSDKFRTMAYGLTSDENEVNEAVQELMLYFLQANPDVIKKIYDKDGIQGITRYGAVALRRALTSPRSNYYYKYRKYYKHIDSFTSNITYNDMDKSNLYTLKHLYNLPNEELDSYQWTSLEKIDEALESFTWYDRKIFELYYYEEGNTLDSLAAKTGISRNSLFTTIDKVRVQLKNMLNE
jgi:DNA-directed RNA polymerase specialized sigma24 family protein